MSTTTRDRRVSKKRTPKTTQPPSDKTVIYLEVDPHLKDQMNRLAARHNRRLTGECVTALQEYIKAHEAELTAGD